MGKILITGGLGFIGGALAGALAAEGREVRSLDPYPAGEAAAALPEIEYMAGSVSDAADLKAAFEGVSACVHLAGSAVIDNPRLNAETSPEPFLDAATRLFAEAVARDVPVIYASSAAVYGDAGAGMIAESTPAAPANAHGEEKLVFETLARRFNLSHGLPSVGMRMFNIYGADQSPRSPYCGVLRLAVQAMADGVPVTIHGDGSHLRDYVHVDDVVRFVRTLLARPPAGAEVVNVCSGRGLSVNEAVALIADTAGLDLRTIHVDTVSDGVTSSVGDPSLARDRYGFETRVTVEQGIAATVDGVLGAATAGDGVWDMSARSRGRV